MEEFEEDVELTEEEEAYLVKLLDESLDAFKDENATTTLEEWREELIREYHVDI